MDVKRIIPTIFTGFNPVTGLVYLLVIAIPLAFTPWAQDAFELTKQSLLLTLGFLILLVWGVRMVFQEKELRFTKVPLHIPVFAFLLLALLSAALSVDRGASFFNTHGAGIFVLMALVGLYIAITNSGVFNGRDAILRLTSIFLGSLSFVLFFSFLSLFGVLERFSFLPALLRQPGFTLAGMPLQGTVLLFAVILPFLIALWPYIQRTHVTLRFAYFALFLGSAALLLIVDLSSAWIIIALTMMVFLGVKAWQRRIQGMKIFKDVPWLPVSVMLFSVIFLFSPMVFTFKTTAPQPLLLDAPTSWGVAWGGATDNIKRVVVGSGIATYGYDFSQYRPASFNETSYWQVRFNNAGNYMAEILATMGILGFLLYIGVFVVFFAMFLSLLWRSFKTSRAQPLYLPFGMGVVSVIISQFVYPLTMPLALTFWLFLALFVVSLGPIFKEYRIPLTKSLWKLSGIGVVAALLLFVLWLSFSSAKAYAADIQYARALRTGSTTQKIQALTSAFQLNPRNSQYLVLLAKMHMDRALEELRKPEELQDKVGLSHDIQLSLAYVRGEEEGDGAQMQGAIEVASNRVVVWESMGQIYKSIAAAPGALDWSINAYKQAIKLEPTNPALHLELGRLYAQREEFDMAEKEFAKAIMQKEDYILAFIEMSLIQEKKGDADSAIFKLEQLAVKYRSNIDIRFQLGTLYYNAERPEDAIMQFELVLLAVPNNSNVLYSLGAAYESAGRTKDAIVQFEKALALNPNNQDLESRLRRLKGN